MRNRKWIKKRMTPSTDAITGGEEEGISKGGASGGKIHVKEWCCWERGGLAGRKS